MLFCIGESVGDGGRRGENRLLKTAVIATAYCRTQGGSPATGLLNIDDFQWQIAGITKHLHPDGGVGRATGKANAVGAITQRQNFVLMQQMRKDNPLINRVNNIGIIINNPEFADVRSLERVADTRNACVPILAIPTTAGTAAA